MSDVKTDVEQLYKDCYQRVLTMARLMLKNDDEASDTVSDVFARLAEGSLKMPDDHPDRYLMVIVRRRDDRLCRANLLQADLARVSVALRRGATIQGNRRTAGHQRGQRL